MPPKIHSQNYQSGKFLNCYYNLAKSLLLLDCRTFFVSLSLRKQMLLQPKTFRWFRSGGFPKNFSNGVLPCEECTHLFVMWKAALIAKDQNVSIKFAVFNIHLTIAPMVLHTLSTFPFSSGVYVAVNF